MPPLVLLGVLALLVFSQHEKGKQSPAPSSGPKPNPPPGTMRARDAMPKRPKPGATTPRSKLKITHPANAGTSAPEQAAVDAAVAQAVRDMVRPNTTPATPPPKDTAVSDAVHDITRPDTTPASSPSSGAPPENDKRAAALALLAFLIKTHRFGNKNDRPPEVIAAQAALGVTPDGIVGPATRVAAKAVGVALPPRS